MSTQQEIRNRPGYRRSFRNILINPGYQLRYVFWIGATGLCLVTIYSTLIYHYIQENYAILVDLSPMSDEAKAQLYRELHGIILRISLISLGFLAAVCSLGVLVSHRTAGPLFHFERIFKQIKGGDLKARIHLRPKDDFKGTATAFNEMMDQVLGEKG